MKSKLTLSYIATLALAAIVTIITVAVILLPVLAHAATGVKPTEVEVPWGDAAAGALEVAGEAAWLAIVGILSTFAPWAWRSLKLTGLDQLLEKALNKALEDVREDLVGKKLTVDVRNEAVALALQYAIDNGAGFIIKWAGGPEGIKGKLLARFNEVLAKWLKRETEAATSLAALSGNIKLTAAAPAR